jgi:cytochrome c
LRIEDPLDGAKGALVKQILSLLLLTLITACSRHEAPAPSGSAAQGSQLIAKYGCDSCHIIPGIETARGVIGPSLEHVATRPMLATTLPNTPDNMVRYIQNPQLVGAQNTMPNLGVKPDEARDIAAYLSTLK